MRILSIDGGGIRGIVPATVLAALEERAGRPVCELFDLVAGTSTGGIIALALTCPGPDGAPRWTAAEIARLYVDEGPRIFRRSLGRRITSVEGLIDERYPSDELRAVLQRYLGDTRLEAALTPVLVTAYDLVARRPRFFKSWREDAGVPMALAAEATAAAPTYFEPVRDGDAALIDGGVFAGNPAMCAYAEGVRLRPSARMRVLSLGTGSQTRPIIDVVFDGSSDTVDYQLDQLLDDRHLRLQIELEHAKDDMDDVSPRNLAALEETGRDLVARNSDALDAWARALAAG